MPLSEKKKKECFLEEHIQKRDYHFGSKEAFLPNVGLKQHTVWEPDIQYHLLRLHAGPSGHPFLGSPSPCPEPRKKRHKKGECTR